MNIIEILIHFQAQIHWYHAQLDKKTNIESNKEFL